MLALFLNVYFCNLICPTLPPCFISVLLGVFVSGPHWRIMAAPGVLHIQLY